MCKFHAPKTKAGLARAGPYTVASSAASIPRAGDLLNAVSPVKSRKLPVQADVRADVRLFGENASLFNDAWPQVEVYQAGCFIVLPNPQRTHASSVPFCYIMLGLMISCLPFQGG